MSAARRVRRDVDGSGGSAASTTGMASGAEAETGPASSRCIRALIVAINQAPDVRQWYTGTKELQLASLQLCKACRIAHTVHLRVDGDIPTTLLGGLDAHDGKPGGGVSSRISRPQARRVTWKLQSGDLLTEAIDVWVAVEELYFGTGFTGRLAVKAWPSRLRRIEFDERSSFNQPIVEVAWPASLQQLIFGRSFNQTLLGVKWPPSLLELTFLDEFDQSIEGVKWPPSLQQLTFGHQFNQPIRRVKWPPSLQQLTFGADFDQPVNAVKWPPALEEIVFGMSFNQPLQGSKWRSLRRLTLKGEFCKVLKKLGTTMPALERLTLVDLSVSFAAYCILLTIQWPANLSHLTISSGTSLSGVSIPPRVVVSYIG
ncbi:unnamed protein product [Scytosiphon promiscuus]